MKRRIVTLIAALVVAVAWIAEAKALPHTYVSVTGT